MARLIEAVLGRSRGRGPAGKGGAVSESELTGSLLATQQAIEARFEAEGIDARAGGGLRARATALAVQALANLEAARSDATPSVAGPDDCVPAEAAAWVALSVLEASDVLRAVDPNAWPRKLRPVLWAWVEPPELARIPSRRIATAAPVRLLGGMVRRAWRRRMRL